MKSLPLPIRVAAGLAVTAVEQARTLPAKIAGLPVTVASQALQVSMRVQQQVTELAIRGDEVLASLRPVEDTPAWATFDEDIENDGFDSKPTPFESAFDRVDDEPAGRNGYYSGSTETLATPDPWAQEEQAFAEEAGVLDDGGYGTDEPEDGYRDDGPGPGRPWAEGMADDRSPAEVAHDDLTSPRSVGEDQPSFEGAEGDPSGSGGAGRSLSGVTGGDPSPVDVADSDWLSSEEAAGDPTGSRVGGEGRPAAGVAGGERSLPEVTGYDELSLPQLRARLRRFDADELAELLDYERAHGNRPSFVGMLTRRIAAVRDQR